MDRLISCELLSKIIIFETKNNLFIFVQNGLQVVNCFQKLLSSRRRTTVQNDFHLLRVL